MIKVAIIILLCVIIYAAYTIGGPCEIKPMFDHPQACIDVLKERL